MFTVIIDIGDERAAVKLRDKWEMPAVLVPCKKLTECPHCGCTVSWYLNSDDDCNECRNNIPPFSDVIENIRVRLGYYKGTERTKG